MPHYNTLRATEPKMCIIIYPIMTKKANRFTSDCKGVTRMFFSSTKMEWSWLEQSSNGLGMKGVGPAMVKCHLVLTFGGKTATLRLKK
jgi:hypothetical protein